MPQEEDAEEDAPGTGRRPEKVQLDASQQRLKAFVDTSTERAMAAHAAEDDEAYETLLEEAASKNSIMAGLGPGGSGKSFVIHECIRRWEARGARILLAVPTGQLSSEMRAKHPTIDVDTCHGAFLFHKELTQALPVLSAYDLVVVDEVSMLTAEHFDRLYAMWVAADRLPCMVFLGDFWQLPGPQKPPSKVTGSQAWKHVKEIQFNGMHRCDCPRLAKKLGALRTSTPSKKLLKKIADPKHRAWDGDEPCAWDILQILRETNYETTMVAISRRAADLLNKLAVQVLFTDRHQKPLAQVPLDWETAPENYENKTLRKQVEAPVAEIYEGMRVVLTKNLNKKQAWHSDGRATC